MIRIENLTKTYRGSPTPALEGVKLQIEQGELVFLVGSSGSGKSTLLRLLLCEEKPDSGEIFVLGQNLRAIPQRRVSLYRRRLGVVFQDYRLLPTKTVYQNIAFALEVIGKSRAFIENTVPDVLRLVGLQNKFSSYPAALSGGEQQRVAIARALANRPDILLADEPTGNLDPENSDEVMGLLGRINHLGTTVVMATHDRGIVDQMQRRVVEIKHGRIVRDAENAGYFGTPSIRSDLSENQR